MATIDERRAWIAAAQARVSTDELRRLAVALTAIPSPSGDEAALAAYLVAALTAAGLDAAVQPLAGRQANAAGRYAGDGSGPALLLYAPIDLHIAGNAADDGPWLDLDGRADLVPAPQVEGDYVIGLGAENPKGHAACIVAAANAIARAGIPLRGDLIAGFGAGGMPVNASPDRTVAAAGVGHGVGAAELVARTRPDFAVIAKPGAAVAHEEVGLCWFELTVRGDFNYAGLGLRGAQRNPVLDAATVISALETWLPSYTARNTSGLVAPRGSISAVHGGWPDKPAFVPERCIISLDLRIGPRTTPDDAQQQLEAALDAIRSAHPGIRVASRRIVAIPGTSTPPDNWIVQAGIRAWEAEHGRPHAARTGTSGATDANILRAAGIPTARIGMGPLAAGAPFADRFSMGVVSVTAMAALTRMLIAVAIDTCTRERAEVGLNAEKRP